MHRISKVEHIQEELLRILINPTAQLDEAARGGSGYGDAPVTVNSVLESLYKQMRDGRGGGSIGNSYGGRGPGGIGVAGGPGDFNRMAAANAGIAAATQAGMAAGIANPAFLGIYDPAQIEAFYQGARSGNTGVPEPERRKRTGSYVLMTLFGNDDDGSLLGMNFLPRGAATLSCCVKENGQE